MISLSLSTSSAVIVKGNTCRLLARSTHEFTLMNMRSICEYTVLLSVADSMAALTSPRGEESPNVTSCLQAIHNVLRPERGCAYPIVEYCHMAGTQLQEGSTDCGVFMIGHIHAQVCNVAVAFSPNDIPLLRHRLVLTLTSQPGNHNTLGDHTNGPIPEVVCAVNGVLLVFEVLLVQEHSTSSTHTY